MQMLYHVNFGPPLLGPGSEVVAAVEELAPRDVAATADVPTWNRYVGPSAGRGEQVHFARVRADAHGTAAALLLGADHRGGARLSWRADTLPCFTLWKNQGGLADGCVTGLEPGTNYPNPRSFEEAQGRVVSLSPGAGVRFELALEHVAGEEAARARAAIESLAAEPAPRIHERPRSGWSPG